MKIPFLGHLNKIHATKNSNQRLSLAHHNISIIQELLVSVIGRRDGVHRFFRPDNERVVDGLEGGGAARQGHRVTGEQASLGVMIWRGEAHWNGVLLQYQDKRNDQRGCVAMKPD